MPFLVSSCGPFCYAASRPNVLPFVSSCRLVLYRPVLVVSLRHGRGAERPLRGVPSPPSCYIVPALVLVPSHPVPSFEAWGGAVVACRSISSGVLCRLVVSVRHGRGVSRVVSMLGNRADKNGAFCLSYRLRLIQLVLVLRGDENRARSNNSETRARCRSVRTPRRAVYARRPFPPINLPACSSPDLGAGEHLTASGQGRAGGRGSGEKEKRRACLLFLLTPFVFARPPLRLVFVLP